MKRDNIIIVIIVILLIITILNFNNIVKIYEKEEVKTTEVDKVPNAAISTAPIIVEDMTGVIYDKNDKYSCLYINDIDEVLEEQSTITIYYEDENGKKYDITIDTVDHPFLINFNNNVIRITDKCSCDYLIVESDNYVQDSDIRALNLIIENDKETVYTINRIKYIEGE